LEKRCSSQFIATLLRNLFITYIQYMYCGYAVYSPQRSSSAYWLCSDTIHYSVLKQHHVFVSPFRRKSTVVIQGGQNNLSRVSPAIRHLPAVRTEFVPLH